MTKTNIDEIYQMRTSIRAAGERLARTTSELDSELNDLSDIRQAHIDMPRLPMPLVALKAPWLLPDGEGGNAWRRHAS